MFFFHKIQSFEVISLNLMLTLKIGRSTYDNCYVSVTIGMLFYKTALYIEMNDERSQYID